MRHDGRTPETQGDVLIQGLWEIQTEEIIDVRFGDADMQNYKLEEMDNIFPTWETLPRGLIKKYYK